jgi:AAA15 family ATPase/GTPase
MKISKIHLKNFKRFTDLLIENIPEQSKLVLLIGANGSGKSSVFDAFVYIVEKLDNPFFGSEYWNYFQKQKNQDIHINIQFDNGRECEIANNKANTWNGVLNNSFYCRTSFRQLSRLTRTSLGQTTEQNTIENDSDRPQYFIDRDNRFENDVERITEIILKELFRSQQSNEQIKQKYITPINATLQNIFGNNNGTRLELIEIIPPLEGKVAQITFKKGNSEIHYNLLSAGEKEVFNLLLNLLSRREQYQDTIYVFDEIDLHLNTKLQFNLLKEITENWIPENCQLWTASHSLGFIEYAKQSETASIIDFDNYDFDLPRILTPEPKDNPDIYEIAVGKEFLPSLFKHMKIVFVENKDRDYYASVGIENTVFVSDNNRNNVYHKVRATQYHGIVDRDFLSDDDIIQIRQHYPNLYILYYYSIENYFYHPDNLEEYNHSVNNEFDKAKYIAELTEAKNTAKEKILPSLSMERMSYPYFGEPEYINSPLQKRFKTQNENKEQASVIASYLSSNDFEIYYKSLPMKSYCTQLPQRQNLSKTDLVKTNWFKKQVSTLLEK